MAPDALHVPLARPVPVVPGWDHSMRFLADPYRFISRECHRLGSDVVLARLMLLPTLCLTGPGAAQLFHDTARFRCAGDAPGPARVTPFGKGAMQTPQGAEHLARERFLMTSCGTGPTAALVAQASRQWDRLLPRWSGRRKLVLYPAMQEWLTRTACAWAGVPLAESEVPLRTGQLAALFDNAASGLAAPLRARRARFQAGSWLAQGVRSHRRRPIFPPASPAAVAAELVDARGRALADRTVAVELLNLLRPVVAISVFVVLAAHALHRHPGWRDALAAGADRDLHAFVQEVRRFYPFFPAVAAQVCRDFAWNGWQFRKGTRALLDLYGTNHDGRAWPQPHEFRPERFFGSVPGLFDFVPHGGGRTGDAHRCAGEAATLALMKLAVRRLATHVRYRVPLQDLDLQMDRLPALPGDRFVVDYLTPV